MCLGSAHDILASGRPPRATFVNYPLGHTAGKPFDPVDQYDIVRNALLELGTMTRPGEIRFLPNQWDESGEWKNEAARTRGADTRRPRDETPQFQSEADREAARPGDR